MSPRELCIAIIDENRIRASIIEEGLRDAGHHHVVIIDEVREVARRLADVTPDVVVIDLENPNRDMLEHFFSLSRALQKPIAMGYVSPEVAAPDTEVEIDIRGGHEPARIAPLPFYSRKKTQP